MTDKREKLTNEGLLSLAYEAQRQIKEVEMIHPHFNAKVARFNWMLQSQKEIIESAIDQYIIIDCTIKRLENLLIGLRDDERKEFEFINLDEMKAEQKERLESIRILLTKEIPGLDGVPIINYQPERD